MQVVLFGASKAGEFFVQQNPGLDVIAFLDNDANRHGTAMCGIPVLSPSALSNLTYDRIIITSQWVDAIRHQLLTQCGINEDIIDIPCKQQVKSSRPFEHPATLQLAHRVLGDLNAFLSKHQLKACLDSGTLLGVIRQQDLIPWDDDIDLAVDAGEFATLSQVLPHFVTQLPYQDQLRWQMVMISVNGEDCCINIEYEVKQAEAFVPFDISLQMRRKIGESSELVSSAGLFFAPADHFSQYGEIEFLNQRFYVPSAPEDFLTFMYGDWQQPKQGTRITEYQNRRAQLPLEQTQVKVSKRLLADTP